MPSPYSQAYIQLRQHGPFPGRIDPFAEAGRYFQQIHSGMIQYLQDALQDDLNALGYQAGKEASLQVFASRKPDVYVQDVIQRPIPKWDYAAVASALALEAGTAVVDEEDDLDALHITRIDDGTLVTVLEVIAPRNKTHLADMSMYRAQRQHVFLAAGVSVVEVDATRSTHRLLWHPLVRASAYQIAVYLPGALPRVLVSAWDEPLKPFALPLRGEALRTEPQAAYDRAYQRGAIAGLLTQDDGYSLEALPFASTLTEPQQQAAMQAVQTWRAALKQLMQDG